MWAQLKTDHVTATRSRAEIIVIGVACVLIAVMLTIFATVARDQVRKAELRDALVQAQSTAIARCWANALNPSAMRSCSAELASQVGMNPSYDLRAPERPQTGRNASLVSYQN